MHDTASHCTPGRLPSMALLTGALGAGLCQLRPPARPVNWQRHPSTQAALPARVTAAVGMCCQPPRAPTGNLKIALQNGNREVLTQVCVYAQTSRSGRLACKPRLLIAEGRGREDQVFPSRRCGMQSALCPGRPSGTGNSREPVPRRQESPAHAPWPGGASPWVLTCVS